MLAIRKAWKWAKARQTEQTGRLGSAASVDGGRSAQLQGGRTSRRWCPLRPKTFHVEKRKTESLPTEKINSGWVEGMNVKRTTKLSEKKA